MTLYCQELDATGCGIPDCGHDHTVLYLHPRCHRSAATRASYDKRTGLLTLRCRQCNSLVAEIAVAEKPT
jgi:hypothetical protein